MTSIYNGTDLTNFLTSYDNICYVENSVDITTNMKAQNSNKKMLSNASRKIYIRKIVPSDNIVDFNVNKDMYYTNYNSVFVPYNMHNILFPGLAYLTDIGDFSGNIVAGDKDDRLLACCWNDLGNDVFDTWGFFYLYDVLSGRYYFPLLNPLNEEDGVIISQTFVAFDRIFTIEHGWASHGVFKMKITVNDTLPFRFGAYGDMGSDEDEVTSDLTATYTKNGHNLTLYYRKDAENGDDYEKLWSYLIPTKLSENNEKKYDVYYNGDYMSLISKPVTEGLYVYFAKTNDAKNFVINDLVL